MRDRDTSTIRFECTARKIPQGVVAQLGEPESLCVIRCGLIELSFVVAGLAQYGFNDFEIREINS